MIANALDNQAQALFLLPQFSLNALTLSLYIAIGSSPRQCSLGGVQAAARHLELLEEQLLTLGFIVHEIRPASEIAALSER
ncbi:MAG TPA: hypothetical protein VHB79_23850 [Polyangiaceae bacterium]|nr:hypothetical protein [Polyangiaceae bacterium]